MAGFVLRGCTPNKIVAAIFCGLILVLSQAATALAQRVGPVGGHPVRTGGRAAMPVARPAMPHAPTMVRPGRAAGVRPLGVAMGARSFRVPIRPIFPHRRGIFAGALFPLNQFAGFNRFWWSTCGPIWNFDYGCGAPAFAGNGFENYVTVPMYVNPPSSYLYGPEAREEVWLYLRDGTVYTVTDYWFVDGQVRFTAAEEPGGPTVEQTIGIEELDFQKTIEVNTRRGFRLVMRDQPWEQYLHDHPDATPPPMAAPDLPKK